MERKELNLGLGQELETRIEQERVDSVFAHLRGFSAEYGMQKKEDFVNSLDNSLSKNKRPIVLAVLGEAASAKTNVARDLIAEVFGQGKKKTTKTKKLLEQGEEIPVEGIFWGDVSTLTKSLGKTEGKIFGEYTTKDNSETTKIFEEEIAKSARESQGRRKIILAEGLGVTGVPWVNENPRSDDVYNFKPIGADRGVTAFWNLRARKGLWFKGLNYDTYWLCVVAEPGIRELGKKVRAKLGNVAENPKQAIETLKEAGVEFDPSKIDEVIKWAHSSANLESIKKMENQTNELIVRLAQLGAFPLNLTLLREDGEYRAEIIGRHLIPHILKLIKVGKRHIFIAHNYVPLTEGFTFNTSVPIENVILRRYPQVAKEQNKR